MGQEIVGIDTPIFVYFFQRNREYFERAQDLLRAVENGKFEAVFSSVGMIELFTGLKKQKRNDLVFEYKASLRDFPHLTIMGMLNEEVVDIASGLRVKYNIATPDAIHIATAVNFGANKFITNDRALKKVKEITIELI